MVDLNVRLGRLSLKNPVLVASGTFGYVREMASFLALEKLGGVIPKTVTARPRAGNPTPRTVETASGMLNAIGLDNDGIEHFRQHHLPYLRTVGTAVIANIAGEDEDQFVALSELVGREPGLSALELNLSCPNVSHGLDLGIDAAAVERVVSRVRAVCPLPIIAKLTPNVTDIVPIARGAASGGADAVSLVNTFKGMAIDWRRTATDSGQRYRRLERAGDQTDGASRGVGSRPRLARAGRSSASAASSARTMRSSSWWQVQLPFRSARRHSMTRRARGGCWASLRQSFGKRA